MGLRQHFRFTYSTLSDVQAFLRSFNQSVNVEDQDEFFAFTQLEGTSPFTFDCEIVPSGLLSERAGSYFTFLGQFVEATTGRFGPVEISDL